MYVLHGHPVIQEFACKKPVLTNKIMFVLPGWSVVEIKAPWKLLRKTGGGEILVEEVEERVSVAGKMARFVVVADLYSVDKEDYQFQN